MELLRVQRWFQREFKVENYWFCLTCCSCWKAPPCVSLLLVLSLASTGWHMLGKSFHSQTFVYLHGVRQAAPKSGEASGSLRMSVSLDDCLHFMRIYSAQQNTRCRLWKGLRQSALFLGKKPGWGGICKALQCAASAITCQSGDQDDDGSSEDTMSYTRRLVLS